MMKRIFLASLLLVFVVTGMASATVVPSVEVGIRPLDELPEAGKSITVTFEITSPTAGLLTDIHFRPHSTVSQKTNQAQGWDISGHTAPTSILLAPKRTTTIDVTMVCRDPSEMVRFEFKYDGTLIQRDFYLVPMEANESLGGLILQTLPGSENIPIIRDESRAVPGLHPDMATEKTGPLDDPSQEKISVRLYGRIVYYREDGAQKEVDGITVRAYKRGLPGYPDVLLGSQVTDSEGNFDFNASMGLVTHLFLRVVATNQAGSITYPGTSILPYQFETPTMWNWSGLEHDFNTLIPPDMSTSPAFHLMTTLTRAWRLAWNSGYSVPYVTVRWPSSSNAFYSPSTDVINISTLRQWHEFVLGHEYGHHFNDEFGGALNSDYCNPDTGGYSDGGNSCGHSAWCPENSGVAWSEGFADWYGAVLINEIQEDFYQTISTEDFEFLQGCAQDDTTLQDARITEGYLATLCLDVSDDSAEFDPSRFDNGHDSLSLGNAFVLDIAADYDPETPAEFVTALILERPDLIEHIWETGANNRYDFDTSPPPSVTALYSTSHQVSGDSPDRSVDLWWNEVGPDPYSGFDAYVIYAADNPNYANQRIVERNGTGPGTATVEDCYPGQWWFKIYARDQAGNLSTNAPEFGPVTIRLGTPPDLVPSHGVWPQPVLAKGYIGAPFEISPFLFGNIQNTYYSVSVGNGGELDAVGTQHHRFYVDGLFTYVLVTTDLDAFGQQSVVDVGPDLVRGGRHNLTFIADADEERAESDEDNNWYSHQYIWTGMGLDEVWKTRGKAPDAWAGFKTHTIFSSPNCDGFAYSTQVGEFRGVVLVPLGAVGDFGDHDLKSFPLSTGSTDGFNSLNSLARSNRPAGCLDAVFGVNDLSNGTYFNVGAYRFDESGWGFKIRRVSSVNINAHVEIPITIVSGDYLNLYRVSIGGGNPGGDFATLRVNSDPADGLLHAAVFDMATAHAGLDDPLVTGQSDANGEISLDFDQINGRHMVAVWQDPKDASVPVMDVAATLWIGQTPPDLKSVTPAGWYASVVPTDGAPGSPGSVPEPTQLQGNSESTYFNYAIYNDSPTLVSYSSKMTYLDGNAVTGSSISQMAGYGSHLSNYGWPLTVPGGRHTLSGFADNLFELTESSETNNAFGRQWIWSPLDLTGPGGWSIRSAPPEPDGGWDHVLASPDTQGSNSPVYFNCDGLRTPLPSISGDDGWWQAVAILAQGSADYDLRLHEMDSGVKDGFAAFHEQSNWSGVNVDYVMVNFRDSIPRQFDVGVVATHGSKSYYLQLEESTFLGSNPAGSFGAFTLAADGLVRLHEIYLDPGQFNVRALNVAGTVDWGLSLHLADRTYHSMNSALDDGTLSWLGGGPGGDEELSIYILEAGYYCVAVWRASYANAGAGQYNLEFDSISGVEDELPPAQNALVGAYPNPFNPMTTIEFELARDNQVSLVVFDIRGARIRELVNQGMSAGRHEKVWNGMDDRGQQVPSGTYFIQLRAGNLRQTMSVSLVK